jgi:hypothetical protein
VGKKAEGLGEFVVVEIFLSQLCGLGIDLRAQGSQ